MTQPAGPVAAMLFLARGAAVRRLGT